MKPFTKRTFTLPLLMRSLAAVTLHLPVLGAALVRPSIGPALREKIMLAVTRVNDCRYCSWVHTGLALKNGIDMDALNFLLGQQLGADTDEAQAVAILFAKHFADTVRHPSQAARDQLAAFYGGWQRREIMAHIHMIYFSNLTGNSADAVLARLRGRHTQGSLPAQLAAALIGAPVLAMVWLNSRRSGGRTLDEL